MMCYNNHRLKRKELRAVTPIIFDSSDGQDLRINMISPWLKKRFGYKVVKLALDGGFTCPNRDGSKGTGGCLFCSASGSGDMASTTPESQISLLSTKWPKAKYIAYFQSHTNTYATVGELRSKFEPVLKHPDVIGIAIATRSDCLPGDVVDYLAELNEKTFLWVELGLQTIHSETARVMNLCHDLADYDDAVQRLTARRIRVVTHLILGLPGETRDMMEESVRYICGTSNEGAKIFGLKLHMLNVVKGSGLCEKMPDYVPFDSIEEYVDLLISMIEIIPSEITLHRISGDAPRSTLIAPDWSYKKRTILNMIHQQMRLRDSWQGKFL